ncbi:hypothetical protein Pcinc_031749 [Petrolisthes cinctipes]|uniref:Uncharacterized protein n=1 Tax=Petrolisthes cinctipes TaxID=88211 RepID=A0AAE1EVX3_PETCI|nr:hypothetical protein Pcinc_031749 [Petrolisthes cinctipes]
MIYSVIMTEDMTGNVMDSTTLPLPSPIPFCHHPSTPTNCPPSPIHFCHHPSTPTTKPLLPPSFHPNHLSTSAITLPPQPPNQFCHHPSTPTT